MLWLGGIGFLAILAWLTLNVSNPALAYLMAGSFALVGIGHLLTSGLTEYGIYFIILGLGAGLIAAAHNKVRPN